MNTLEREILQDVEANRENSLIAEAEILSLVVSAYDRAITIAEYCRDTEVLPQYPIFQEAFIQEADQTNPATGQQQPGLISRFFKGIADLLSKIINIIKNAISPSVEKTIAAGDQAVDAASKVSFDQNAANQSLQKANPPSEGTAQQRSSKVGTIVAASALIGVAAAGTFGLVSYFKNKNISEEEAREEIMRMAYDPDPAAAIRSNHDLIGKDELIYMLGGPRYVVVNSNHATPITSSIDLVRLRDIVRTVDRWAATECKNRNVTGSSAQNQTPQNQNQNQQNQNQQNQNQNQQNQNQNQNQQNQNQNQGQGQNIYQNSASIEVTGDMIQEAKSGFAAPATFKGKESAIVQEIMDAMNEGQNIKDILRNDETLFITDAGGFKYYKWDRKNTNSGFDNLNAAALIDQIGKATDNLSTNLKTLQTVISNTFLENKNDIMNKEKLDRQVNNCLELTTFVQQIIAKINSDITAAIGFYQKQYGKITNGKFNADTMRLENSRSDIGYMLKKITQNGVKELFTDYEKTMWSKIPDNIKYAPAYKDITNPTAKAQIHKSIVDALNNYYTYDEKKNTILHLKSNQFVQDGSGLSDEAFKILQQAWSITLADAAQIQESYTDDVDAMEAYLEEYKEFCAQEAALDGKDPTEYLSKAKAAFRNAISSGDKDDIAAAKKALDEASAVGRHADMDEKWFDTISDMSERLNKL